MYVKTTLSVISFLLVSFFSSGQLLSQKNAGDERKQEEAEDYFQKWLNQDVVYIINEEEKSVFRELSTPEEKEAFIEQFWIRRDPDPRTAENEFKEEHYRRIAYANEFFRSGKPGWRMDRGRVYIIHGPPAQIESHPSGGVVERPLSEGGGRTSTFPFEVWRYRRIEGIDTDVVLEFVDPNLTGEYRLALHPEEKDALLNVPGVGLTLAESFGIAEKRDRPWFSPGERQTYPMMGRGYRDNPFYRFQTYTRIQVPQKIKYDDLKQLVTVDISYSSLPFLLHEDYFRLNETQSIVPINIRLKNQDLTFETEGNLHIARVAVYGIVTSISNRLVAEFEDDLITTFTGDQLVQGLLRDSIYQKVLVLDSRQRYKLDLVVRDQASENMGTVRKAIVPPSPKSDSLTSSSVIFTSFISFLESVPDSDEMFVLGDLKIIPNPSRTFSLDSPLGIYFQIYNARIDQSTQSPSLKFVFTLFKDGKPIRETVNSSGESIQYYSTQRVVAIQKVLLDGLTVGNHLVKITVEDLISGESLDLEERFELIEPE